MTPLNYDQAKSLVENYKTKDRIQVLCFINLENRCPLCNGFLSVPNQFTQLEDEGIIDVYYIDIKEAYGFFQPPFSFLMQYYIPWVEEQSPQSRGHYLPYPDMKADFMHWKTTRGIK
jgi:hypothetical protein